MQITLTNSSSPALRIGRKLGASPLALVGTLDEVRLTIGASRDLTVQQTAPWPNATQSDPDIPDTGWVDITTHREGFDSQVKRFTITRTRRGATGADGIPGLEGADGEPGVNGTFFHVAYASSADGSVGFNQTGGAYIGTYVDTNPTDSVNYLDYAWVRLAGIDGENGIPGADGSNGQTSYLHIKYSNDNGVTFTASNGEVVGDYMGQYVDFTLADSTLVGDYTWARIKGADGTAANRGTVNVSRQISGSVWSDSEAVLAISTPGYGAPQNRDIVTLYNSAAGFSETRFYDSGTWLVITEYINGNLLVAGTIAGTAIAADTITAAKLIKTAALITETAQIGAATIGTASIVDLSVSTLKIEGEAVTVPRFASNSGSSAIVTPAMTFATGATGTVVVTVTCEATPGYTITESDYTYYYGLYEIRRQVSGGAAGSGTLISSLGTYSRSNSVTFQDTPGVGSWQYELSVTATAGDTPGTYGYKTLLAFGVKR